MITWILQSSLCWLFFLLIYRLFLQKETFFRFNRYYLVGTLILGGLIPLVRSIWVQLILRDDELPVFTAFQGTARVLDFQVSSASGMRALDWLEVLSIIYWMGVIIVLIRLARECWSILKLIRTCPKTRIGDYIQVTTHFEHLPFSFLHYIFISDQVKFKDEELSRILRHESSHVTDFHTLDVLLVEIISAFAWLSPFVYWYKKSIRNTHEYLADALVTLSEDKNSYGRLLIDHSQNSLHMALANHFIYSQLKNRINMMMKLRSKPIHAWKYALIIPILLVLGILFAYKSDVIGRTGSINPEIEMSTGTSDSIYTQVDLMPQFPGCNHLRSNVERSNCSLEKMMTYVSKIMLYPGLAKLKGIQGTALVSFVVNLDGSISQIELKQDPGEGTGAEAMRVVESMNRMGDKWSPGLLNGRPVRVQMVLPVKFKMDHMIKKIEGSNLLTEARPVMYILNGEHATIEEINNLLPEQISRMSVFKDEKAVQKYGEGAREGVIEIETKPKYVVDGIESNKEAVDNIPADQIATMDVVGYGKKPGVISIRTKSGSMDPELKEKLLKLIGSTDKTLLVMDGKPTKLDDLLIIADKIKSISQLPLNEAIKKYGEPAKFGAVEFSSLKEKLVETKIFNVVDEMPRFPGCEGLKTNDEKQKCAIEKMSKYIYSNLSYPKLANQHGIEGKVIVSFVVDKFGKIVDPKLVKDIGGGCGDEALRVIQTMNNMSESWTPGIKNGKVVSTEFNLPIQFKLSSGANTNTKQANVPQVLDKNNPAIKLIPNPSSNQVEIVWDKTGEVQIGIYDITGKRLHFSEWQDFRGSQLIDVKSFSAGTYVVKLRQGLISQEQKLIIQ